MHSPNTDSPKCPEGYRCYVYRINVRLPLKAKFPAEPRMYWTDEDNGPGDEPDTDSETIIDANTGLPKKKKKKDEKQKIT